MIQKDNSDFRSLVESHVMREDGEDGEGNFWNYNFWKPGANNNKEQPVVHINPNDKTRKENSDQENGRRDDFVLPAFDPARVIRNTGSYTVYSLSSYCLLSLVKLANWASIEYSILLFE